MSRDVKAAALRLAWMTHADLIVFAKHDPDMIRDVAKALIMPDRTAENTCADALPKGQDDEW